MDGDTGLGCDEKRMGTLASPRMSRGDFTKVSGRKTRAGEVYPERTVGTLYRSISPGDSAGPDRAGVYRARVGVNITTDEEKHKDKYQRWVG